MVAKSFQELKIESEPYSVNGKMYVNVRTKSNGLRKVRWYTDKEYARMYPDEKISSTSERKTQKETLGFDKGYITIFTGNTYEDKDYFKENSARYTRLWGWYFTSTTDLPNDIPDDVTPIQLPWELVGTEDGELKPEDQVIAAVASLTCEPDDSEYQGAVGEKIERIVVVEKAIPLDGYFGHSTMHVMRDYDGNCYVWTTAARTWAEESEHHIVGTIKELKQYKSTKQTILTRCREVN